jgi:hypothetical protein
VASEQRLTLLGNQVPPSRQPERRACGNKQCPHRGLRGEWDLVAGHFDWKTGCPECTLIGRNGVTARPDEYGHLCVRHAIAQMRSAQCSRDLLGFGTGVGVGADVKPPGKVENRLGIAERMELLCRH